MSSSFRLAYRTESFRSGERERVSREGRERKREGEKEEGRGVGGGKEGGREGGREEGREEGVALYPGLYCSYLRLQFE